MKIGEPLNETLENSGFNQFLSRPFEGLSSDFQQETGYSYQELVENMETIKAKDFTTTIAFTSTDYNTVTWAAGNISYQDGLVTPEIATSNTGNMTARTYIYYDPQASKVALNVTTDASVATQGERLLLAIAVPDTVTTKKAEVQTFGATGMYIGNLSVEHLTAGTIRSKAITLDVAAGTGDSYIAAGKTDFTNTQSGFILGIDDSDSDKAKFYIGDSTKYLNWDGSALVLQGVIKDGSGTTLIDATGLVGSETFNSDMKYLTGSDLDVTGDHQWAEMGFDYTFTLTRATPYFFFGNVGYSCSGSDDDLTARIKVGSNTYYPNSSGWEQANYKPDATTTNHSFTFMYLITIPSGTDVTVDLEVAGITGDETISVTKANTPRTFLGYIKLGK